MHRDQYYDNDPWKRYAGALQPVYGSPGFVCGGAGGGLDLYPGHAAYSGWLWPVPTEKRDYSAASSDAALTGAQPTTEPAGDMVDTLLADRLAGLDANIERIHYELGARDDIHRRNVYRIDFNMMQCRTEMFECEQWVPATNSLIERRRTQADKKLLDLEGEKRAEDMMNWRDRQMLLRDLREVLTERQNAARRIDLLDAFPQGADKPDPGQVTGS